MLISSKRKPILCLITIFIIVIGVTVSVFAESGTAFSFTLENKYNNPAIETISSDSVAYAVKAEQTVEISLPQTGDEASVIWWFVLMFSSGSILAMLYFNKLSSSKNNRRAARKL